MKLEAFITLMLFSGVLIALILWQIGKEVWR